MAYYKDEKQWQVLPDKDFYQSLEAEGAEAYEAISEDGQRVGRAIITANGNMGELAFLYDIHFYINRCGFHAAPSFSMSITLTPICLITRYTALDISRLLRDRSLTFTDISDMFGFSSLSHFSRYVQTNLGAKPSDFRE